MLHLSTWSVFKAMQVNGIAGAQEGQVQLGGLPHMEGSRQQEPGGEGRAVTTPRVPAGTQLLGRTGRWPSFNAEEREVRAHPGHQNSGLDGQMKEGAKLFHRVESEWGNVPIMEGQKKQELEDAETQTITPKSTPIS